MSQDDDSEIAEEIPVYLSHDLSDHLLVFQYPSQPASRPGYSNVVTSKIKPENQEVVLEIGLDTNSANFDRSHGEQLASVVDKDKTGPNRTYQSKLMDRIRLESINCNVDRDSFAVGTMRGKELIISPVRSILSLNPSFSHLSRTDNKQKEENEEEEAKLVRVQFHRAESDRAKKAREASYNHYMEKTGGEPWYITQYHNVDSDIAKLERTRLVSGFPKNSRPVELSSRDFLSSLIPKDSDDSETVAPAMPDHLTSLSSLKQLPLYDQVRRILEQVKTLKALQLSWILSADLKSVIECLQKCAVLVQGNWVLRSDLFYSSVCNGIPQAVMATCRDYILYEFHQGRTIERKNLKKILGLPQEEIRTVMNQLASLKRNKVWQFRLPPDVDFVNKHSEVVEQQNLLWEARMRDVREKLELNGPSTSSTSDTATGAGGHFPPPAAKSPRRRKDSESSEAMASNRRRKKSDSESSGGEKSPTRRRKSVDLVSHDTSVIGSVTKSRKKSGDDSGSDRDNSNGRKPNKRQRKKSEPLCDMPAPIVVKQEPEVKQEPL